MQDKQLPESFGEKALPPIKLTEEQSTLCEKLDLMYVSVGLKDDKPSDLYKGALFVSQLILDANSDWISQACHSLRDILYPFYNQSIKCVPTNKKEVFQQYGSVFLDGILIERLGKIYGDLTNAAHHGRKKKLQESQRKGRNNKKIANISREDFEKYIADFESVMRELLVIQLDIHAEIDKIVAQQPIEVESDGLLRIINVNLDARNYFFSKTSADWFEWLIGNNFFAAIQDPSEVRPYPELSYLERIAIEKSDGVVKLILSIAQSPESHSIYVIDRFLFIVSKLPAEDIEKVACKIKTEGWLKLMNPVDRWGHAYELILDKLYKACGFDAFFCIAEEVLALNESKKNDVRDSVFLYRGLIQTKLFDMLETLDDAYIERAFGIVLKTLKAIVDYKGHKSNGIFKVVGPYELYEVDFFEYEGEERNYYSDSDTIKTIALCVKKLSQRMFNRFCVDEQLAKAMLNKYIVQIADNQVIYGLRLYILSLCPHAFRGELRGALFEIFQYEDPKEMLQIPEYLHLVQHFFTVLDESEKREYVSRMITTFNKDEGLKMYARQILSLTYSSLIPQEIVQAEVVFGELDSEYKPTPRFTWGRGGMVIEQPPGNDIEWSESVQQIVSFLKDKWAPKNLKEYDEDGDFLRPINAHGAGERIRTEMANKPVEYLTNAGLFIDRDDLHPHYTYSYLRGVSELIEKNQISSSELLQPSLDMMQKIMQSGIGVAFVQGAELKESEWWLTSWDAVHRQIAEILIRLLSGETDQMLVVFADVRDELLALISYLFKHQDPEEKDEVLETAKSKVKGPQDEDYVVADPYTNAINSVRGKAFKALVLFIFHDGKRLAEDVKVVYRSVLVKEKTRALLFLFGHNLPVIYFRDKDWALEQIRIIFSTDGVKGHLFQASLEGYLANNIYKPIFFNELIQGIYRCAIQHPLAREERRYFKELDEGLGTHLALAFIYFEDFSFNHELFKLFWEHADESAQGAFISFIGRMFVSGSNSDADDHFKKNDFSRQRLLEFWDWALERDTDPSALVEFSYWMNMNKNLFEIRWLAKHIKSTIEKCPNGLDWDYGLTRILVSLAQEAPEDTLEILRLHLLENGINKGVKTGFYLQDEWKVAFEVLYATPSTKDGARKLISDLLHRGGSSFWPLEEIVK